MAATAMTVNAKTAHHARTRRQEVDRTGSKRRLSDPRPAREETIHRGGLADLDHNSVRGRNVDHLKNRPSQRATAKSRSPEAGRDKSRRHRLTGWIDWFFEGQTLEKSFVVLSFLVALIMILPFGCDLICGWPFWQASRLFDVSNVVCGMGLAYLCWNVAMDLN